VNRWRVRRSGQAGACKAGEAFPDFGGDRVRPIREGPHGCGDVMRKKDQVGRCLDFF